MEDKELIEKMAVIMDRLDRMERKIDELNKHQNVQPIPITTPTYPFTPQIWYTDKKPTDFDRIMCTGSDYTLEP